MKKLVMVGLMMVLGCVFAGSSLAGYKSGLKVERIRTHSNGFCSFAIDQSIPGTCSHYGEVLRFDTKTLQGDLFYKTLLSVKLSGKSIVIWYSDSTASGMDQRTGCTDSTMAVLTGIGLP